MDVSKLIDEQFEYMVNIRRRLHTAAELSEQEFETAKIIQSELDAMHIPYSHVGKGQGMSALLRGAKDGRTVAVRADMDALPVTEKSDSPFKSKHEGVMHACGHDAHMAIALGCARALSTHQNDIAGNVKFIFQPAEETDGGALDMINCGVLENPRVERVIGGHVMPAFESGTIMLRHGAIMAAPDEFDIKIIGKGGHGAYPAQCVNPIYIAAKTIAAIEELSHKDYGEYFVVSCCVASSDTTTWNLVPDSVLLGGTVRTLSENLRGKMENELCALSQKIAAECGGRAEFTFRRYFPPTISDDGVVDSFAETSSKIIGSENVIWGQAPSMAGEDFSYFALSVPSVFIHIGCGNKARGITHPLHSSLFDIDEGCLKTAAKCYCANVLDFLSR